MRPNFSYRYFLLTVTGIVFFSLGTSFARAEQDPDRRAKSLAAYTMGTVYDLQGSTDDAIREYQKSSSYNDHYMAHIRVGTDYARLGRLDEAIAEFNFVLRQDKDNVQARYLLALVYSSRKDYDKAADNYEAILNSFVKEQPQNAEIYGYLGQLYYAKKEYGKAISQFEKVLLFQPGNADVMYALGGLYLETKDRVKAKEIFSRCVDRAPEHDGCLNSLGYMYAEDGEKLEDARRLLERALIVAPDNGAYLDSLGWIYFKLGQSDKALEFLQKADAQIKDPEVCDHIGDVYFQMHRKEDAKKYWKLSLELLPGQTKVENKLKSVQ